MDFYLRYRGPLPANGSPKEKATIREYLSPQLEDLFRTAHQLKEVSIPWMRVATSMRGGNPELGPPAAGLSVSPSILTSQVKPRSEMFYRFPIGRYNFIPLVTRLHGLVCEIDLTFLRRQDPGAIVNVGGDIDNRLKTLFDALRLPHGADELGRSTEPDDSPNIYCLLEDDVLVTRLGVLTGRLLGPLHASGANERPTDVELHMHVTIRANVGMYANLDFL
jgi:hypothetical protein